MSKKDLKDIVLDTSLPITAGVKLLSELTGADWTEEQHLAAVATLAKIQANAAALQRILDVYQPIVAKLAKAHGVDVEGIATLKVPQVNGEAREVAVQIHVGEESTTKQTLDADAIRGATGYTVTVDPEDPRRVILSVADAAYWGYYKGAAAAVNPTACEAAVHSGKLGSNCQLTKTTKKFGVTYQITDTDELMKGGN